MTGTTTDRAALPAQAVEIPVGTEKLSADNPPVVGEIIAIHSRGSYRLARVTKVTKTRVETEYTTQGAIKESRRIFEMYTMGAFVTTRVKQAQAAAHRNFAFYASEANPVTRKYYADTTKYDHAEKLAQAIAITDRGLEAYVADEMADVMLGSTEAVEDAKRRGPLGYLTVTRKTVSFTGETPVYRVQSV